MERIVFNELYEYCNDHNLLTWRNAGFKKNESTANQLLLLVHKIYETLGTGDEALVIFLDVSKAFDKVYHKGLLHKLESFGISGRLFEWFYSYLHGRKRRVVINGKESAWRNINAGVPQGSILGPLLYLIFANDLVDDLKCEPFLYADDTSLLQAIHLQTNLNDINRDLELIANWSAHWRVTFNIGKTEYMIFSKKIIRPRPLPILFNQKEIKMVSSHCHLGVWFTENMSWSKHVHETIKKTSVSLNILKRMPRNINRKTKLSVYKTYIRPKLEYSTFVFNGNLTKDLIDDMENIQRQALLTAVNAYRHTSHEKLLLECGIEPLLIRRRYFGLCHLYKIIHGLSPHYLNTLLPAYVQNTTNYALRNARDFSIPRTNKNYVRLSFFWSTLHNWNALSNDVRQSASLAIFKKQIKEATFYIPNKLFDIFTPKSSVHHARMRMGLSALNAHRRKYNFITYNNCPLCGEKPDDVTHTTLYLVTDLWEQHKHFWRHIILIFLFPQELGEN
jgi:ribonuclease P/MRP protein subunit RPP40